VADLTMASTYTSAAALYRLVSEFAQRQPDWADAVRYQTTPDERWDMTLVSQRVYGNRDEFLTVLAAAGLDSLAQELTPRVLVLPSADQLRQMKARSRMVTEPWTRPDELAADPVRAR
jgi:hypothetical protein